ncbi:MAG: helix-turn-helix domain-containing protein [Gemmatimonadetes bacterium]|nr:helix-turn-helix domain-containing protein [Gemmatimonadota bacterium]
MSRSRGLEASATCRAYTAPSRATREEAALADATRRGILERLGRGVASISDLATDFDMTLTGIRKHVGVQEQARLVTTGKVGRVRTCRLGPSRLEAEAEWVAAYQRMLESRFERLDVRPLTGRRPQPDARPSASTTPATTSFR